ncbi:MAG: helix-turn-helix transcriptional regulator [Candidatus Izemoplasmatales bacterium]|nr:helix-turn-helix transcriptional regulator [Candidatus Cloacimonadota bacterium]MDY0139160.1 helix-turn-helix transcriptional regulator [Candidatus Izemoplasmatales bacterium]
MSQYYIKKRKLSSFIDWIENGKYYADVHLDSSVTVLTSYEGLSFADASTLEKEKQKALKFLEEFNEYMNELNDVEKVVANHIRRNVPLTGMSDKRYQEIRNNIYIKWCRKFMPSELIYVHEIDMDKFAYEIRKARLDKRYTIKSVAEFLLISESTIRSYETGRRLPRLNILFALLEIYEHDFNNFIKLTLI